MRRIQEKMLLKKDTIERKPAKTVQEVRDG